MRYPDGHKEAARTGIIRAAARALRRDGLAGVSIPALMKEVGLTHGGFYGHFDSRDDLVAEAVLAAATETAERVLDAPGGLDATLGTYLSRQHVDGPGEGCVLAALGTEGARQAPPVRRAFAKAAVGFLRRLERKVRPGGPALQLSDETLALASRMVGAVVLARLVDDDALAEQILKAARPTAR